MYQGDQFARTQHMRRLLDASQREPDDGGLQFLIGLTLFYDGQRVKARQHFLAAEKLPGVQQFFTRFYLPVKQVAEVAGNGQQAKKVADQ